jgi:histidinol-phosphate aminotransferase
MAKALTRKGIKELIPYPPGKPIEELERELGITGSIKLASNENPLGPSPEAVKAVLEHVNGLNRYPDGSGYYLKSKLGVKFGLPLDQLIIGNGSNEIIELIIRTFLSVDDEVIQAFPTFLVYDKMVKGAGGKMISIPLANLKIDLDAVRKAVTPRTKIIFINNPNNPTGSILNKKELTNFFDALPGDILVVLDEAYIEFVNDPGVAQGIDLLPSFPLMVVLRTFSKLYGLAGLRIGYGFSSREVIDYMNRVRQPFNVNTLAQAAATAALDDETFVSRTLKLVKDGLSYLYDQLQEMGLETIPTETNFFLVKMPVPAKEVYEKMLREGVIIRAMDSYDLEQYIRVNVGLPEENERFIATLKKVLKNLD